MELDKYTVNADSRPIALTLGDPAGVGPEVAARLLAGGLQTGSPAWRRPVLCVGSRWALEEGARVASVRLPEIPSVSGADEVVAPLALLDLEMVVPDFEFGRVDASCGQLAVQSVETAARLCLEGGVAGMVPCPINKEAIHAAGYVDDIGHRIDSATRWSSTNTAWPRASGRR